MTTESKVAALAMMLIAVQIGSAQQSAPTRGLSQDSSQATQPASTASKAEVKGNLEVLSDIEGVDFGTYLSGVRSSINKHWNAAISAGAMQPTRKKRAVGIQFVILPSGKIAGMQYSESSGDIALDRAAWGAITASNPVAPLPPQFHGPYLGLRYHFDYSSPQATEEQRPATPSAAAH